MPALARRLADDRFRLIAGAALLAIAAGGLLHLIGLATAGDAVWTTLVAGTLAPLSWSVAHALLRRHAPAR